MTPATFATLLTTLGDAQQFCEEQADCASEIDATYSEKMAKELADRIDQAIALLNAEPVAVAEPAREHETMIGKYRLVLTCGGCPEQYDVLYGEKKVAYLRLRHGHFRAEIPDCGGKQVYSAWPVGDGIFEDDERERFLTEAINAVNAELLNAEGGKVSEFVEEIQIARPNHAVDGFKNISIQLIYGEAIIKVVVPLEDFSDTLTSARCVPCKVIRWNIGDQKFRTP